MDMDDYDDTDATIDELVAEGSLEEYENDGELMYRATDIMQELHPELYEFYMQEVSLEVEDTLMSLYEKGLITVEYELNPETGELEAKFSVTEDGHRIAEFLEEE